MRALLVAAVLAVALPGPASGAALSLASRDVHRGSPVRVARFDLVGLHWRGPGTVRFRTRSLDGHWSAWRTADPEDNDGGERSASGWQLGSPLLDRRVRWAPGQHRGRVTRVRAYFVRSARHRGREAHPHAAARGQADDHHACAVGRERGDPPRDAGLRRQRPPRDRPPHGRLEQLHGGPIGRDRAGDRDLPRQGQRLERHRLQLPRRQVRPDLRGPVRRHDAGRDRGARDGVQRGQHRGRADRQLQLCRDLVGGKAALVSLLAWRLDLAHVDPLSKVVRISAGNSRYTGREGGDVRAISGHRDAYPTGCPGSEAVRPASGHSRGRGQERAPQVVRARRRGESRRACALHGAALELGRLDGERARPERRRGRERNRHGRERRLDPGMRAPRRSTSATRGRSRRRICGPRRERSAHRSHPRRCGWSRSRPRS